jgi:hypothetical protein
MDFDHDFLILEKTIARVAMIKDLLLGGEGFRRSDLISSFFTYPAFYPKIRRHGSGF